MAKCQCRRKINKKEGKNLQGTRGWVPGARSARKKLNIGLNFKGFVGIYQIS